MKSRNQSEPTSWMTRTTHLLTLLPGSGVMVKNMACSLFSNLGSKFKFALTPVIFIKKSLTVIFYSALCVSLCTANENIDQEKFKKWDFAIEQKKRCSVSNQIGNNDCISREYKVSDAELNRLYKSLINDLTDPKPLKESQLAWIKFRDLSCKYELSGLGEDNSVPFYSKTACLINLTEKRILDIKQYSDWNYDGSPKRKQITSSSEQLNQLIGVWHGSDRAARAIYGTIVITDNTIAWGGKGTSNPGCKTEYSIEKEPFGVSFKNQTEFTYVFNENSQFKTYKLKLVPHECLNKLTYLRFTLPFRIPNYADVVEYYENNNISGYIHFQKFND